MGQPSEATVRRIAIVLGNLPEDLARRLLSSLPSGHRQAVGGAIRVLSDVDPLERRRALEGFTQQLKRAGAGRSPIASVGDEFVPSSEASIAPSQKTPAADQPGECGPLGFLVDVDDDTLLAAVRREHPQTIAIVLASISPSQAARVLRQLDVTARTDTMRRLTKLNEIPGDAMVEIAAQLKAKLGETRQAGSIAAGFTAADASGAGRRALEAILAEMPPEPVAQTHGSMPARAVNDPTASGLPGKTIDDSRGEAHRELRFPRLAEEAEMFGDRRGDGPRDAPRFAGTSALGGESWHDDGGPPDDPIFSSADRVHQWLIELPIAELRDALAQAPTRQAILALCGLPSATGEALLASLPRRQAKQVRQQLVSIGAIELREIDDAKRAVAKLASEGRRSTIAWVTKPTAVAA